MIDRARVLSLAVAVREHAEILEAFAIAPDSTPRMLELEALGRANLIEGRLAQLRAAVDDIPTIPIFGPLPRNALHVLGDRPTEDPDAA